MKMFIGGPDRQNPIIGFVFLILFILLLLYVARWIYIILLWLSPVLLVLTAVIDYRVFVGFGRTLSGFYQKSILQGIFFTGLIILVFPLVCIYLLAKALLNRKIRQTRMQFHREEEPEFAEFEIIEEEDQDETKEESLELPELDKERSEKEE